jgi:SAM-dependent methyltransferase
MTADPADIIAHVHDVGDVAGTYGAWVGRPGSRRWIEGFQLSPPALAPGSELEYQAMSAPGALSPWVQAGQYCGTRGQSAPLHGFSIRTGGSAPFDCSYTARFVDGTEIGPIQGGTPCHAPSGAALEAFRIVLQPRQPVAARGADVRGMPREEIQTLEAGAQHYRAYVGPPEQYDLMGATQFRLLTTLGLREHHRLLDFGCGSLRAGRLLIPYLLPGHYYGIEPNSWLIEDAIAREIGQDQIRLRHPVFRANADFSADGFGVTFDFILAQSIFSHTGRAQIAHALASFQRNLAQDGLVLATFVDARERHAPEFTGDGWAYPDVTVYREETVAALIRDAGLLPLALPWYHPRQRWYAMARNAAALPPMAKLVHLSGAVLREAAFIEST